MQQGYGFARRIRSALALPGMAPAAAGAGDADLPELVVTLGPPQPLPPGGEPDWQRVASGIDYTVPALARFACRAGSVAITPDPQADEAQLQAVLVATMLPTALWLDGRYMLHAAGVALDGSDRVVALAGASGAGKSTLAAQLVAQGARLVGDDSLALDLCGGQVLASGLPGGQFLWPDHGTARQFHPVPTASMAHAAPLAAVVILTDEAEDHPVTRLSAPEAVTQLHRHRHRPQVPQIMELAAGSLAASAALIAGVPVYRCSRAAIAGKTGRGLADLSRLALAGD